MNTTMLPMRTLVAGALAATALVVAAPEADAGDQRRTHPFRGDTDWVAYQTYRDGLEGVWLVHPDGSDDHPLDLGLDPGVTALLPDWAPDGTRLAVTTRGSFPEYLYEHDLTTGSTRRLFDCDDPCLGDDEPAYSPDGTRLAFVRYRGPVTEDWVPADCALWIGDLATGALTRVTSDPDCDKPYAPRWSPDGEWITFHRERYGPEGSQDSALFKIRPDGTGEQRLTDWSLSAGTPDWSPDGEWIVFTTGYQQRSRGDLFRIRPDGTDLQRVTSFPSTRATQPRYTPDGAWIVFTAEKPLAVWPRQRSLWAVPAAGGDRVVIAHTERIYTHGTWQP